VKPVMEDGDGIASPPDTSVTSSTSCADDHSLKNTVCMSDNVHSSHGDAEVSSSSEMQPPIPACSLTAVDPLSNQVTIAFLPRDASAERGYEIACRPSVCL